MPHAGRVWPFTNIQGAGLPLRVAGGIMMKHAYSGRGPTPATTSIDALVAEQGALRVLLRAARLLVLPPPRTPPSGLHKLDDRLLRDIGLPPRHAGPCDWRDLR